MKMDHYLSVTMDGVPVYNDLVGGVTLEVLDDFTGIDDTLVKGQTVTLTGQQALTYVQSRQGLEDTTNVARMVRQKQYLSALREKTLEKLENGDGGFVEDVFTKMSDYIISDRSVTRLEELLNKFSSYEFNETLELQGETKLGLFWEFHPDKDSVKDVVVKAFYRAA